MSCVCARTKAKHTNFCGNENRFAIASKCVLCVKFYVPLCTFREYVCVCVCNAHTFIRVYRLPIRSRRRKVDTWVKLRRQVSKVERIAGGRIRRTEIKYTRSSLPLQLPFSRGNYVVNRAIRRRMFRTHTYTLKRDPKYSSYR